MSIEPIVNERFLLERAVAERFLETPNEDSFTDLFKTLIRQKNLWVSSGSGSLPSE